MVEICCAAPQTKPLNFVFQVIKGPSGSKYVIIDDRHLKSAQGFLRAHSAA